MPNWKKVIVSGSNAVLNHITASGHMSVLDGGLTVNTHTSTELEVVGDISASNGTITGNNITAANQLEVKSRKFAPPASANYNYSGDVVYLGSTTGMTRSRIYAWNGSGWTLAEPSDTATIGYRFLGITLGTTAFEGLLIRGFYNLDFNPGSNGNIAYLSAGGMCTSTIPNTNGHISRVMGYIVGPGSGTGEIFFNPSTDWIEIET